MSNVRVQNIHGQVQVTQGEEVHGNQNANTEHSLVVGSSECRFNDIIVAIHDGGYSEISGKWRQVGLSLGLRKVTLETYQSRLKSSRVSILDIYKKILVEWRSTEGENATLIKLIRVLEAHNLQKAANAVKARFGISDMDRSKYITLVLGALVFLLLSLLVTHTSDS